MNQEDLTKAKVIIYSRPGCHLCDVAKAAIEAASCAEDYILMQLNIEDEPALLEKYRNDIPVVTINGVEAFRHRVNSNEFRRRVAEQKSLTSHC